MGILNFWKRNKSKAFGRKEVFDRDTVAWIKRLNELGIEKGVLNEFLDPAKGQIDREVLNVWATAQEKRLIEAKQKD